MSTTARDLAVLKAVAGVVKEHVQAAFSQLVERIKAAESRLDELSARPNPEKGPPGKSITPEDVYPLVAAKHSEWLLDFERRAQDVLLRQLERIRQPEDGQDSDPDLVAAKVIEKLDLKGTRTDHKRLCAELVAAEFAKQPKPPGPEPIKAEQVEAAVAKLLEPMQAAHALDFEKRAQEALERAVDRLPKPKDGVNGVSFDAFEVEMLADGRTLRFYAEAEGRKVEKTVRLDHVIDRGVHEEAREYLKGDGVTWGGSFWIAQKDGPKGKPGQYNRDWRLAVKRGRDGGTK